MRRIESPRMNGKPSAQSPDHVFRHTEPEIEEKTIETKKPLIEVRRKNRRMLAEKYIFENPIKSREFLPCPYPEMENEQRIESISQQPDALHEYAAPRCKCTRWHVKQLGKKLREGENKDRHVAANELAMIASDPEIYLIETSLAALKTLVVELLGHGTAEAREALASLGFDVQKVPRLEIIALIASKPKLWLNKKLRENLHLLEECLESGF